MQVFRETIERKCSQILRCSKYHGKCFMCAIILFDVVSNARIKMGYTFMVTLYIAKNGGNEIPLGVSDTGPYTS